MEFAATAALATAFPVLTRFNVSALLTAAKGLLSPRPSPEEAAAAASLSPEDRAAARRERKEEKGMMGKFGSLLDTYGVAFLLSARLVGISLVFSVEFLLSQGIDLRSWLEEVGLGTVGECRTV